MCKIMLYTCVSVTVCNVAALKCHHCSGVNVAGVVSNAAADTVGHWM